LGTKVLNEEESLEGTKKEGPPRIMLFPVQRWLEQGTMGNGSGWLPKGADKKIIEGNRGNRGCCQPCVKTAGAEEPRADRKVGGKELSKMEEIEAFGLYNKKQQTSGKMGSS
jgi:hypothetical protein